MIEGISSYPKHFLLMLLSDVTEILHKLARTTISEHIPLKNKISVFEELLLTKDTALLYLTINTIMKDISIDEEELKNIKAELKLHKDTHKDSYQNIESLFLESEIESLIKIVGLKRSDDS
tara:strand:+ start:187 stop:549 length:363 start_codon:yes stop_codon:yes gene_type:complete